MGLFDDYYRAHPGEGLSGKVERLDPDRPAPGEANYADNMFGADEESSTQAFGHGVRSGIDQTQGLLYGLGALVGSGAGMPELERWGMEGYQRNQMEAAPEAPLVTSIGDIHSFDDFTDWAAGALGQAVPSLALSAVGGGVGGMFARSVAQKKLLKELVTRSVQDAAEQKLAGALGKDMAKKVVANQIKKSTFIRGGEQVAGGTLLNQALGRGALSGAYLASVPVNTGEIYTYLREQGIDAPATALAGGAISGALDIVPEAVLATRIFKQITKDVAKEVGSKATKLLPSIMKNVAMQTALEGATEGSQEYLKLVARAVEDPNFDPNAKKELMGVLDAAAAGAIVGLFTGGGGGIIEYAAAKLKKPSAAPGAVPAAEAGTGPAPAAGPAAAAPPAGGAVRASDDTPSAEGSDALVAQFEVLRNPDSGKTAVLVPFDDWKATTFENRSRIASEFIPVTDRAGKLPGKLFVLTSEEANAVMDEMEAGVDPQEIVGKRTGSGLAKPTDPASVNVQGRNEQGQPIVDALAAPAEVPQTVQRIEAMTGQPAVVEAPEVTVARRAAVVAEKGAGIQLPPSAAPQGRLDAMMAGTTKPIPNLVPSGPVAEEVAPAAPPRRVSEADMQAASVADATRLEARQAGNAREGQAHAAQVATFEPVEPTAPSDKQRIDKTRAARAAPISLPPSAAKTPLDTGMEKIRFAASQKTQQKTKGAKLGVREKGSPLSVDAARKKAISGVEYAAGTKLDPVTGKNLPQDRIRLSEGLTPDEITAIKRETGANSTQTAVEIIIRRIRDAEQEAATGTKVDHKKWLSDFIDGIDNVSQERVVAVAQRVMERRAEFPEELLKRFNKALAARRKAGNTPTVSPTTSGFAALPHTDPMQDGPISAEEAVKTILRGFDEAAATEYAVYGLENDLSSTAVEAAASATLKPAERFKRLEWLLNRSWVGEVRTILTAARDAGYNTSREYQKAVQDEIDGIDAELDAGGRDAGDASKVIVIGRNGAFTSDMDGRPEPMDFVEIEAKQKLLEETHPEATVTVQETEDGEGGFIVLTHKSIDEYEFIDETTGEALSETQKALAAVKRSYDYVKSKIRANTDLYNNTVLELDRIEYGLDANGKPINVTKSSYPVKAHDITKLGRALLRGERGADMNVTGGIRQEGNLTVDEAFWNGIATLMQEMPNLDANGNPVQSRSKVFFRLANKYRATSLTVKPKNEAARAALVSDNKVEKNQFLLPPNLILHSPFGEADVTVRKVYDTDKTDPKTVELVTARNKIYDEIREVEAQLIDKYDRAGTDAAFDALEKQRLDLMAKVDKLNKDIGRQRKAALALQDRPKVAARTSQAKQRVKLGAESKREAIQAAELNVSRFEAAVLYVRQLIAAQKSSPRWTITEDPEEKFETVRVQKDLNDAKLDTLQRKLANAEHALEQANAKLFWLRQAEEGPASAYLEAYDGYDELAITAAQKDAMARANERNEMSGVRQEQILQRVERKKGEFITVPATIEVSYGPDGVDPDEGTSAAGLEGEAGASTSRMNDVKAPVDPYAADVRFSRADERVITDRRAAAREARVHGLVSKVVKYFRLPVRITVMDDPASMEQQIQSLHGLAVAANFRQQFDAWKEQGGDGKGYIYRGDKHAFIYLNPSLGMKETVRVLAHELGHVVPHHYFTLLPADRQAELLAAHAKAGQETVFEEWLANQFKKWASVKAEPKSWIDAFFQRVGKVLQDMFTMFKSEYRLDETFEQFMDGIVDAVQQKDVRATNSFGQYFKGVLGDPYAARLPDAQVLSVGKSGRGKRKAIKTFNKVQADGTELTPRALLSQAKAYIETLQRNQSLRAYYDTDMKGKAPATKDELIEFYRDWGYDTERDPDGNVIVYAHDRSRTQGPFESAGEALPEMKRQAKLHPTATVTFNNDTKLIDVAFPMQWDNFGHEAPRDGTDEAKGRMDELLGVMRKHHDGVKNSKPYQYAAEAGRVYFDKLVNTVNNRVLNMKIPALTTLIQKFSMDPGAQGVSADGKASSMTYGVRRQRDLIRLTTDLTEVRLKRYWKIKKEIRQADVATFFDPERFKKTRSYLGLTNVRNMLHAYMTEMGLKVEEREGEFPIIIDWQALKDNYEKVREDLIAAVLLDHPDVSPVAAERRVTEYLTQINNVPLNLPLADSGWEAVDNVSQEVKTSIRNRNLSQREIAVLAANSALVNDPVQAYVQQIRKIVDLGTFNFYLGDMSWNREDPNAAPEYGKTLRELLEQATKEGATADQKAFAWDALAVVMGRYELQQSMGFNTMNDALLLAQSMRTLTFTLFASFPDLTVPMIRFADTGLVGQGIKNYLWEALQAKGAGYEMAKAMGQLQITSDQYWSFELAQYEPNKFIKATSHKFFKVIQMERWSNAMKAMNAAIGRDWLVKHAATYGSDPNSKRYLDELGVSPDDIFAWQNARFSMYGQNGYSLEALRLGETKADKETIERIERATQALSRLVDETSLHANPAEKTLWGNDPVWRLVWHLKSFMYAYYQKVMKRAWHEFKARGNKIPAAYYAAFGFAMGLAAFGLVLRDLVQYQLWGNEGYVEKMSPTQFAYQSFIRTGFLGPAQLIADIRDAADRGRAPLMAVAGPSVTWISDFIEYPLHKTVPSSIPVLAQVPVVRDPMREVLKDTFY